MDAMSDVATTPKGHYLEMLARIVTPVGVILLLALQTQFVTRSEFETANARLDKMEQVLIRMERGAEVDMRHDSILADHETRIRSLEKGGR
jgi:hypothetical protein